MHDLRLLTIMFEGVCDEVATRVGMDVRFLCIKVESAVNRPATRLIVGYPTPSGMHLSKQHELCDSLFMISRMSCQDIVIQAARHSMRELLEALNVESPETPYDLGSS